MSIHHAPFRPRLSRLLFHLGLVNGLLAVAGFVGATVRHVPGDYPTIQAAINASVTGDQVLIASGTYSGKGNYDIELHGLAVDVNSSSGADQTIIDCQHLGRGFWVHEWEGRGTRIENLTIENGEGIEDSPDGGGIFCDTNSPTISQCRIINCHADQGGGVALYLFGGALDRCVVQGNRSDRGGGGIVTHFNGGVTITNCTITGNSTGASAGGGVAFADDVDGDALIGCTISGNTSALYAGGVYTNEAATVTRCIVWGNCAPGLGAELYAGAHGAALVCTDVDTTGLYAWYSTITFDGNCVYTDPKFCGFVPCQQTTSGNWTLMNTSPCLPQNSPCGQLIGARGQGCLPSAAPEPITRVTDPGLSVGRPSPSSGQVTWELRLPASGWMQARVVDVLGSRIKSWALGEVPAGQTSIVWDGRNSRGAAVAPGRYFLMLTDAGGRSWSAPATIVR